MGRTILLRYKISLSIVLIINMGIISKIEEGLVKIVEAPFRCAYSLDPVEVEIEARKTLERSKRDILGKVFLKNALSIIINEKIYRDYEPFLDQLNKALIISLKRWAREKGYNINTDININFIPGILSKKPFTVLAFNDNLTAVDGNFQEYSCDAECKKNLPNIENDKPQIVDEAFKNSPGMLLEEETGQCFYMVDTEIIIGRGHECHLRIKDESVSSGHALLRQQHGKVFLEDMGSANGTRVNNKKVKKAILRDGDKIKIGKTVLCWRTTNN